MTRDFENLRKRLVGVVCSDDTDEKTRALEEIGAAGFFDGFSVDQVYGLKTLSSDIWRTRLEVSAQQAKLESSA